MSTRLEATAVAANHLSAEQLAGLHMLLLEEHIAQQTRAVELEDPADLEPDLAEVLLIRCQEALAEVEAALRLFDEGTYGLCVACGAAIRFERLEAVPAARHCVSCQAVRDREVR
ncbi:MAG TPA: TraR/DksA C4-type zinc finger protein [Acidimicrobiia bacterium]|nr:TraR/DksA C4-type zinc finger protein [Acidimicrobiia bacterium]